MNNRKQTLGREYGVRRTETILGYTVMANKIDEHGKKTNNTFSQFVPVEVPKKQANNKISYRQQQKERIEEVRQAIIKARDTASKIANQQKFECVIICKVKNSQVHFKRN